MKKPFFNFSFGACLFCLLCTPFQSDAQNWKEHINESLGQKYFINASFGLQNSNLRINANFVWDNLYEGVKFFEKDRSIYSHIQFGVVLSNNSDFLIGLSYNERKIIQTTDFDFIDCPTTTWGNDVTVGANRLVKITNFGIPIEFRYRIGGKRFSFYPAIAATADFALRKSQKVDIFLEDGSTCKHPLNETGLIHNKDINIAIIGKLGTRLQVIRNIFIKTEVFYKIYGGKESVLTDFNNTNIYSYGLIAGIEYFL